MSTEKKLTADETIQVSHPPKLKKLVCHVKSFCHTHKIGTRNIGSNTQDKDIKWSWYHLNLNHLLIHKQIPLHVVFITFSFTSFPSFLLNFLFFVCCSHFTASHGKCMEYPIRMNEIKKDENCVIGIEVDLTHFIGGVKFSRFRLFVDW